MNHTEFVNVVLPFTPHFVIVLQVFEQLFAAVLVVVIASMRTK